MATAWRYAVFMREDPAYCSLCHLVREGYESLERSAHYRIVCQTCHELDMIEGNKLLMAHFIQGRDVPQNHGRIRPWEVCRECHMEDATQGAVTMRKSFGHARHVFMRGLGCQSCHSGEAHDLSVDHKKCEGCHSDKVVHGMGTSGIYCLNCHTFKEESALLVPVERCSQCHPVDRDQGTVMAKLSCFECHRPHDRLTIASADCLSRCHGNESTVGVHGRHAAKTTLECLDCHRPHSWRVAGREGRALCSRCHPYRAPATFIN
jgi:hypothetical protein